MSASEQRQRERDGSSPHDRAQYRGSAALAPWLVLGLMACAAAPPRPEILRAAPTPLAIRPSARVSWLPLASRAYPALEARIAGFGASLILDTGANQHALERGAGFWLGLEPRAQGVRATDAVGLSVQLAAYGEVPVQLGLRGAPDVLPLYGFGEPALLESHAAGVISPQRLAPAAGYVELDLGASRVRLRSGALPPGSRALQPTCASADGVPLFVVDATLDGVEGFFVVDTGSDRSSVLLEGRFADQFGDRRRPGRIVATLGAVQRVDEVPDVAITVGRWRGRVSIDAVQPAPGRCPSDGTLGSDVLRHCALRVSREGGTIDCRANAPSSPSSNANRSTATGS